jgi:hypothetical protein
MKGNLKKVYKKLYDKSASLDTSYQYQNSQPFQAKNTSKVTPVHHSE